MTPEETKRWAGLVANRYVLFNDVPIEHQEGVKELIDRLFTQPLLPIVHHNFDYAEFSAKLKKVESRNKRVAQEVKARFPKLSSYQKLTQVKTKRR